MRIRKRFLLSSLPLSSDPQLIRNPTVKSDPPIAHLNNKELENQEEVMMKEHDVDDDDEYIRRDFPLEINHFRKEAVVIPVEQAVLDPSAHDQEDDEFSSSIERWGEKDKVIPLKKRRGNFDQLIVVSSHDDDNKTESTSIMSNKKLKPKKNTMISSINKKKRGNVIMEGSRCSRVNGRGWRCFQQTLVGYSLCEHHLGKGRLIKSVTSLPAAKDDETAPISESDNKRLSTPSSKTGKKKRMMRLGKVKARSIKSLIGQTYAG